jgi:Glycosyl transferase family 2
MHSTVCWLSSDSTCSRSAIRQPSSHRNFEAVRHEYLQSALHRSSAPGSRDQEHDGQGPQGRPGHVQGEEYQRDGSRVEWCIVSECNDVCGTIGYLGIREQFLAATPSRRSLTVFHIAIQISERIEKRLGACNNNASGTRYGARGTERVNANMAYACWCQFGYCIPCQQRLPKFRTIFLRMFGTIAQSIICKPELGEYHLGYQMSSDSSGLCEVRVPTFRRPKLLRRALLSVLEQTYSHWRCVVLDDCPDGSARSIVEAIQDHRIDYLQNPQRLGAVGNIDKSFFRGPMLGGNYAFYWRTTTICSQVILRDRSVF